MTRAFIANVVSSLSSYLSPYIDEPLQTTTVHTLLTTMVTSMKYCISLPMLLVGLSLLTVMILYVLPAVIFSTPVSSSPNNNNDDEEEGRPPMYMIPFILIRDTVTVPGGGGRTIQKPVERVLHSTLESYQIESSQALFGLSQMLERSLEFEEDVFLPSNDGLDENNVGGETGNSIKSPHRSVRLSTRIEERIRQSSVCFDEDERTLHRFLGYTTLCYV